MARHFGPYTITPSGQVTVPEAVREMTGLRKGDEVFFEVLDDPPGCVLLVPLARGEEWWSRGKRSGGPSRGSA